MSEIDESTMAANEIRALTSSVVRTINEFTSTTFQTRGGRLGSGMGLLLEGLWGYHMSQAIAQHGIEVAWIADDQYNDYAVVKRNGPWDPSTQEGELFRIEAKTMNLGADESKAHFAELKKGIGQNDLLLIMTWAWELESTKLRVWPKITEVFIERAIELADLRDRLHLARGGTFVDATDCPDACEPEECSHDGEPLNASGKRERLSGPESRRVSPRVSFAANFGGLFRMIGTSGKESRELLQEIRRTNAVADSYVDFVNRSRGRA